MSNDINKKWGSIPLKKLSIDTTRLKCPRAILADEPILNLPNIDEADHASDQSFQFKNNPLLMKIIKLSQQIKALKDTLEWKKNSKKPHLHHHQQIEIHVEENGENIQNFDHKNIRLNDADAQRQMRDCLTLLCISNGFEAFEENSLDILHDIFEFYVVSVSRFVRNMQENPRFTTQNITEEVIKNSLLKSAFSYRDFCKDDHLEYYEFLKKKVEKLKNEIEKLDNYYDKSNKKLLTNLLNEGDFEEEISAMNPGCFNDDDSCLSINEAFLQELGAVNSDEEIDKLFQIIGCDPFSLIANEFQ